MSIHFASSWIFLLFLISSGYLLIYLECEVITSLNTVLNDLFQLTSFLWDIRAELTDITIISDNIISYYSLYWSTLISSIILISLLILLDRIPSSWKQLTLGNRITTSRYNNKLSLFYFDFLFF